MFSHNSEYRGRLERFGPPGRFLWSLEVWEYEARRDALAATEPLLQSSYSCMVCWMLGRGDATACSAWLGIDDSFGMTLRPATRSDRLQAKI
jgi:hypothetical protein